MPLPPRATRLPLWRSLAPDTNSSLLNFASTEKQPAKEPPPSNTSSLS